MSRHRTPGGRHPHPRPTHHGAALPGAEPSPAPARPRLHAAPAARSAVRNGLQAAAVTGGALALVMPALTVEIPVQQPAPVDATLRLAADGQAVPPPAVPRGVSVGTPVVIADGDDVMLPSVLPVAQDDRPEPPQAETADLLKAAGLFDLARQREERAAAKEAAAQCDAPMGGLGKVRPWVRSAAQFLACLYGEPRLIGVASRGNSYSGHPLGLAIDFMITGKKADELAQCALDNKERLGVDYVIWKQRINYGDGWERMADRGGITANHFDHVHVSFLRGGADGTPVTDVCG